MPDVDQCDDSEEVNNFNRFVSKIISGLTKPSAESEVCSVSARAGSGGAGPVSGDGMDEPLVEMVKELDLVRVIIELKGVGREEIRLFARPEELSVMLSNNVHSYSHKIPMPCLVDAARSHATFKNGVLEVVLARARTERAERIAIL